MTELLTAEQVRAAERDAISAGVANGLMLMERAGAAVVDVCFERWPELTDATDRRALILCGPGNNGGDGFVVARLLSAVNWRVTTLLYGDEAALPPDAAENLRRWRAMGGEVAPLEATSAPVEYGEFVDLLVDAVFGAGLSRPLPDDFVAARDAVWRNAPYMIARAVAVDTPSGLCMDSGRPLGDVEAVDLTITFHRPRIGHFVDVGPRYCGALVCRGIGVEHSSARRQRPPREGDKVQMLFGDRRVVLMEPFSERPMEELGNLTWRSALRWVAGAHGGAHKYERGAVLVASGPRWRTGAARLAARAALRVGAGVVTMATPGDALDENAAHLTAIMQARADGPEEFRALMADPRLHAVAIGMGFGAGRTTRDIVRAVMEAAPKHRVFVLDADALTSFESDPETLFDLIRAGAPERAVLTPHMGEFARLFPDLAQRLASPPRRGPAYSRVEAAREAALRSGAVVVLKGADTIVASRDGDVRVHSCAYERAAPWLATAGSGDVLAGVIAGLAARAATRTDHAAWSAAVAGAALHAEAGLACGPGLIAEDLPEALPGVLKRLIDWRAPGET